MVIMEAMSPFLGAALQVSAAVSAEKERMFD
jgi:hypothetical protein